MDPIPAANPYETPGAPLADHVGVEGFIPNGRQVPAGHASAWWSAGWHLMKKDFWPWVGAFVVFMIISLVIQKIPIIGMLSIILQPIFLGGLYLGARESAEGGHFKFASLFSGFQNHAGQLALVGLIYFAVFMVLVVGAVALGVGGALAATGLGMAGGSHAGTAAAAGIGGLFIFVAVIVGIIATILATMAYWLAPTLVVNHGLTAFAALKMSFSVSMRNFGAFFLYGLIAIGLGICCIFTLMLGMLVLWPVWIAASYMASRDLFLPEPMAHA